MSDNQNVGIPRVLPRPDFDVGSPVDFTYTLPFTFTGTADDLLGDAGLSEEEERQMLERYHAGVNY